MLLKTSGERLQQLSAKDCGIFLDWALAEDLKSISVCFCYIIFLFFSTNPVENIKAIGLDTTTKTHLQSFDQKVESTIEKQKSY